MFRRLAREKLSTRDFKSCWLESLPNGLPNQQEFPITNHENTCRSHTFHTRSEEHTSELQSLRHLVCRLLLEKNKNNKVADAEDWYHLVVDHYHDPTLLS